MRLSYRKKLFFYFLIVFAVFAAIVVFVQQNRERTFRNDEFKRGMDVYATLISKYIAENHLTAPDSMSRLDSLLPLLPRDLRISIIDRRGNVLFDQRLRRKTDRREPPVAARNRPSADPRRRKPHSALGNHRKNLLLLCAAVRQRFRPGGAALRQRGETEPESGRFLSLFHVAAFLCRADLVAVPVRPFRQGGQRIARLSGLDREQPSRFRQGQIPGYRTRRDRQPHRHQLPGCCAKAATCSIRNVKN